VHLKSFDHEHGTRQRMSKTRNFDIAGLLESDAIAMHGVAMYAFGHR
jgi:hypothetical protein